MFLRKGGCLFTPFLSGNILKLNNQRFTITTLYSPLHKNVKGKFYNIHPVEFTYKIF